MAKKVRVNFEGVDKEIRDRSQRAVRVPEGDYIVKILEAEVRDSERSGAKYIRWTCQIVKPDEHKGKRVRGNTSLKPEALWSLRNLIHAATGKNVAGKAMDIDLEKLYGKVVGAAIEDNEYERDGETRIASSINTFFPKDEAQLAGEEEEEDEEEEEEETEEEEDEEDEELEDVEVEEL